VPKSARQAIDRQRRLGGQGTFRKFTYSEKTHMHALSHIYFDIYPDEKRTMTINSLDAISP
jgi:hypothetical protein